MPSSSKKNTLKIFPATQPEAEKLASTLKEVGESEDSKEIEGQRFKHTEGDEGELLDAENKGCLVKSERSEDQLSISQTSTRKLKENENENEKSLISMQLEDVD